MFCPKCGSQLPEDARFCGSCGTSIGGSAPAAQSPTLHGAQGGNAAVSAQPPAPKRSKAPIFAGVAALVVVAAVVVAGVATNWFGLAAGGEPQGLAENGPMYVVARSEQYDSHGNKVSELEDELDGQGNVVVATTKSYVDGKLDSETKYEYTRDANGFATEYVWAISLPGDDQVITYTLENEFDDNGLLAAVGGYTDKEGWNVSPTAYKHYDNGVLQETKVEFRAGMSRVLRFDRDGYAESTVYEARQLGYSDSGYGRVYDCADESYDVKWNFDSSGHPESFEVNATRAPHEGSEGRVRESAVTAKFTVDTDSAGNITAVYDENGTLRSKWEFVKVDNPSLYVRTQTGKGGGVDSLIEWPES